MSDENKRSIVVDGKEVVAYLEKINAHVTALVSDLNTNIEALNKMLSEVPVEAQGETKNVE